MTAKERLQKRIDEIDEQRAEAILLLIGDPAIANDEPPDLGPGTSEDDPFWGLIGLVGDEYDGPTDVSTNIHKYVADAIESEWRP